MSDRKAVIKNADMSEEMQQDAVDCATQAMEKYNIEKDIAAFIKREFDKKYNPTWHAIVGRTYTCINILYREFRELCDARDKAFHLLLPRTNRHPPVQEWLARACVYVLFACLREC
jgi:hypothetical protein